MSSSAEGRVEKREQAMGRLKLQAHSPTPDPGRLVEPGSRRDACRPHGLLLQPRQMIISKRLQRRTLFMHPSPANVR